MFYAKEFIGKYYDDDILSEEDRAFIVDNEKLNKLKQNWDEKSSELNEHIKNLETLYEHEENIVLKSDILKTLKDAYEKLNVSNKYQARFCSVNNLPLLTSIFNNGKFINIEEADSLTEEYDNKIYFSSDEYHKKEKKYTTLTVILGLISTFIIVPIFYGTISGGFMLTEFPYGIPAAFACAFACGWGLMAVCAIILIPLNIVISFFLLPKLLRKIIFKDNKISEEFKKKCDTASNIAITSGIIAGASTQKYLKDHGEVKFK